MGNVPTIHRALARELTEEELEMVGGAGFTGGTEYTTHGTGPEPTLPQTDTDAGGGWDWG